MNRNFYVKSIILFILLFTVPLVSENIPGYLTEGNPDVITLITAPPADGTPEQKADLAATKRISSTRTKADVVMAKSQIKLDFFTYSPVIGSWFKESSFPVTVAFFKNVEKETKRVTNIGKNYWKRKRPYDVDKTIPVIEKEETLSYPSGHASRGMVYAAVLAEIFPEKKDELLKFGYNVGWYRVIAGAHHPIDIYGGRVLGQAIARELIKSPKFQADLEAVKAEINEKAPK